MRRAGRPRVLPRSPSLRRFPLKAPEARGSYRLRLENKGPRGDRQAVRACGCPDEVGLGVEGAGSDSRPERSGGRSAKSAAPAPQAH